MIITQYGTVIFREGVGPLIEDWRFEREPDDPQDATSEQLLLAYVISWAEEKFARAKSQAVSDGIKEWVFLERAKRCAKRTKVN